MSKSNLKTLILKMQDPLLVGTEGLGQVAFCHWSIGATQKVAEILKEGGEDPEKFSREFVLALGRIPSTSEDPAEKYKNGTPVEEAESLTYKDLENIASSYVEKYKNSIFHWVSYEDGEKDNLYFEKEKDNSTLEYFLKVLRLSVEKSAEQSKRLFEKMTSFGSAKNIFKQFNENQFKIGTIADRINDIQNTYAFPASIEPKLLEVPELPPNPVFQTNELLHQQTAQLRGLSELLEAQGEQAVLLNDQTGLLIGQSNESSRQTKIGIWIAAAGIFLSTIVSGYAIYKGIEASDESSRLASQLINLAEKNSELGLGVNKLLQDLNTRMETENMKNNDNTEILNQLKKLTTAVEDESEVVDAIERLSQNISKSSANKSKQQGPAAGTR